MAEGGFMDSSRSDRRFIANIAFSASVQLDISLQADFVEVTLQVSAACALSDHRQCKLSFGGGC